MAEHPLHPEAKLEPAAFLGEMLLSDDAQPVVEASANPRELLDGLIERKLYPDAYKVLALAMDKRDAVEWALACVRSVSEQVSDTEKACLAAAEAWIVEQSDETRQAAAEAGRKGNYQTPSAWVAAAAGWTGGSVAPPGNPVVPPPTVLTPTAAAGAVGAAAGTQPESQLEAVQQRFVELARPYALPKEPAGQRGMR